MSKQAPQESKDTTTKHQTPEQKEISSRQIPQASKDIFFVWRQSISKLFEEAERVTSSYQKSVANLQNECMETCRKAFETSISFQEELASKSPFYPRIGETMLATGNNLVESCMKACEMQNQASLVAIKMVAQNIKSMNENSKTFQNMSKTLGSWAYWQPREN